MSNKVRDYRLKYGYTQQELADKLNVSRVTYVRKEHGVIEFKASEMVELSKIYNVSISDMFVIE